MKHLIIPEGTTRIEACSYQNQQITQVTIPNSVMEIGWCAFSENQLTEVIIPNSVTRIDALAFSQNLLRKITIHAITPPLIGDFIIDSYITKIYVPAQSVNAYKKIYFLRGYEILPIP